MKLKILVNGFDARQNLINGFASAGYPVCAVKGDTPIYKSDEYYIVVELPDSCIMGEGEGE